MNKTQNLDSKNTDHQSEMAPKIINVFPYVGLPMNAVQQEYAYTFPVLPLLSKVTPTSLEN
jgi:hypothetical protein